MTLLRLYGAPSVAAQHEQPQEPLRGGRTTQTAAVHSAPALEVQDEQPQPILHTDRAELRRLACRALLWELHLMRLPFVR